MTELLNYVNIKSLFIYNYIDKVLQHALMFLFADENKLNFFLTFFW